jgi:hypothetical protein
VRKWITVGILALDTDTSIRILWLCKEVHFAMNRDRKLPNMNEGGRILASILLMHGDLFESSISSYCLRQLIALLHEVDPKRYDKMCRLGIL